MHWVGHDVGFSVVFWGFYHTKFWRKWHFLHSYSLKIPIFIIFLFIKFLDFLIKIAQSLPIKYVNQRNSHQSDIKPIMRNSHKILYSLVRMNACCSKIQWCHKAVNHNTEQKYLDHKWVHAVTVKKRFRAEIYENKLDRPEKYQQRNKSEWVNQGNRRSKQ